MEKNDLLISLRRVGFSESIISAFANIKREEFIPEEYRQMAYHDVALPIGNNQTISQPYTIATMLSLLHVKKGQKILEIGSGSGYVLALLSNIVGETGTVFGIEIIKNLADNSKKVLKSYRNVRIYNQDGKDGLKFHSPFDRILISAACEEVPKAILDQVKPGGMLVAPIGSSQQQSITAIKKHESFSIKVKEIPGFVFVRFV
ncbi:MAG TPA: protein-L-isoaspartate O-methyltransferase [Candidatus Nanoarchaeia archaeon]|nr:protein-L-isoaspartate O-methyltransferase [Candidatus Nanoarchaeia archaeon]